MLVEAAPPNAFVGAAAEWVEDCSQTAEWDSEDVPLNEIHNFRNRKRLPSNLGIEHAFALGSSKKREAQPLDLSSTNRYIWDTYVYILGRLDMTDPVHHLIVMLSIVFSKLLPKVKHLKLQPTRLNGGFIPIIPLLPPCITRS
jgi:hypothetical protein